MSGRKRSGARQPSRRTKGAGALDVVVVENVNHPKDRRRVGAAKYQAMRRAILKVTPSRTPGLTFAEISRAVLPHLPDNVFPGGATAGWWTKTVQLDLEAKKLIAREKTTPLRFHRV